MLTAILITNIIVALSTIPLNLFLVFSVLNKIKKYKQLGVKK